MSDNVVLEFQNITAGDAGLYMCVAHNSNNSVNITINISVISKWMKEHVDCGSYIPSRWHLCVHLAVNLSDPFVEEKFRVTITLPPDEQRSNNIAELVSRELPILVTNRIWSCLLKCILYIIQILDFIPQSANGVQLIYCFSPDGYV